jgi:DNA polymerase III subunit alpha
MGIEVVPANVNGSESGFAVRDGKILFGLAALKGCGGSASDAIVAARRKGGPFRDIFDFCERVDPSLCGRSPIESLIKAGAMDCFGARRAQLLAVVDKAMQSGASALADRRSGQKSLFSDFSSDEPKSSGVKLPDVPEMPERERLLMEKEVLGFYLTSHPLAEYEQTFRTFCTHTTADIPDLPDRTEVFLGGMLSSIKLAHTKNARPGSPTKYANFDFEDVDGAIRSILWPDDYATYGHLVQPDAILVARGVIDRRGGGDEANLIVNELIPLEELGSRYTTGIVVRVDEASGGESHLSCIRDIVRGYPGNCELQLLLCLRDGSRVHVRSQRVKVDVSSELRSRLDAAIGPGKVRLVTSRPRTNGEAKRSRRH